MLSHIGIDLTVEAWLTVESDGQIRISWKDGSSLKRNEIYPNPAIALMRLAVLDHMATNNTYCLQHLPEQCTKQAEAYLSKVTRSRQGSVRPWSIAWRSTRRILRGINRTRRISEV